MLGPVLFSLYMVPLEDIITRHCLSSVIYADDCQVYIQCDSLVEYSCVTRIESCIVEIRCWMRANMLELNDSKTEVLWFSSRFKNTSVREVATEVRVGDVNIPASNTVRDLGVIVDSAGTMNAHISSVCKVASHSLWRIGKLRKYLDHSSREKRIHAFVTSRLDYYNSLYLGLYDYQF